MYVGNNPANHNDPDGHCYPICTAVIGAAIGAIVGATAYTIANHGQSFDANEMLIAAGAGALAGGLIGTGVGILAVGATAAVTTAATFAIGAGTASGIAEIDYIKSNPMKFETKPFAINAVISGVVGGITAIAPFSPAGIAVKGATYVGGAEIQYALLSEDWNSIGAIRAGTQGLLATVFDVGFSYAFVNGRYSNTKLEEIVWPNKFYQKEVLEEAVLARARTGVVNFSSGIVSGSASAWLNGKLNRMIPE